MFKTIRHFAYYLYGRTFKVITDHKPMVSLMSHPQRNCRVMNWALKLSEFSFKLSYRHGDDNLVADFLSHGWDFGDVPGLGDDPSSEGGGGVMWDDIPTKLAVPPTFQ